MLDGGWFSVTVASGLSFPPAPKFCFRIDAATGIQLQCVSVPYIHISRTGELLQAPIGETASTATEVPFCSNVVVEQQ